MESLKHTQSQDLKLVCHFKWGMDGSSGHSQWQQAGGYDDDQVVVTSLVPLHLATEDGIPVWHNGTPNSPRFCRSVAIKFAKETPSLVLQDKQTMDDQTAALMPLANAGATCRYDLQMTMVDGKIVNTISGTSSAQRCSMCGATPSIVNHLDDVRRLPVINVEYGLSSLHCWIRVFEAVLHISYRLPIQQWQVRTDEHRQQLKERKAAVQRRMLSSLGLRVDEPRPGGSGNCNDGNTARRAFQSPEHFAAATVVSELLIRRLHVVLQAISSCLPLSPEALEAYCSETAELYLQHYAWYPMPTTLHRLLVHSAAVIQQYLLPIAAMSEEAAGARHKHVRQYRLQRARRGNRQRTMADVFGRLMITSDPVISVTSISSRRKARTSSQKPLLEEARALLAEPSLPQDDSDVEQEASDDSSEDDSSS